MINITTTEVKNMKKILVVGSNGRTGKLIVNEALKKGYDVTGLGLSENSSNVPTYLKLDVFSLVTKDVEKYDVVVDALGAWTPDTIPSIGDAIIHLAKILEGTTTRLVVVGGAGSLYIDKTMTTTVDMGPDFPDAWKPLSASHGRGLAYLRNTKNLNWTYISPACNFEADGTRTGEYKLCGEILTLNSKGESTISYADFSIALVDEIESGKHNKQRISVVSK